MMNGMTRTELLLPLLLESIIDIGTHLCHRRTSISNLSDKLCVRVCVCVPFKVMHTHMDSLMTRADLLLRPLETR